MAAPDRRRRRSRYEIDGPPPRRATSVPAEQVGIEKANASPVATSPVSPASGAYSADLLTGRSGVPQSGAARKLDLDIIGSHGLIQFGGRVYEEFLPELAGPRWHRIVKEMSEQDPVVSAMLFAIEMLCRRVPWKVEPYTGEGEDSPDAPAADADTADMDKRVAEHVESCMYDMSLTWEDTLAEILTMLRHGYSYMEIAYKKRIGDVDDPTGRSHFKDGLVGWRKWIGIAQETHWRWEFDDDGGVQGFWQIAPPKYIPTFVPIDKALLFRTTAHKNNPEGRSILRGAYRPWYFKKNIENVEGIGVERDLAGLPVAHIPPEYLSVNASPDQKALVETIKTIVTNIRRDEQEGILFPLAYDDAGRPMFDLELLHTGGQRQFDTGKIIERYDQRISMVVLADFVLMGHEKVGSYALATSKTNIFGNAISAWLDAIAAVINEHAIVRLMRLNGWDTSRRPMLTHGEVQGADLAEVSRYLLELAQAGMVMFPNPDLQRHLLELADLPAPVVAEEGEWPSVEDATQVEHDTGPFPAAGPSPLQIASEAPQAMAAAGGGAAAAPGTANMNTKGATSNGSGVPQAPPRA